MKTKMMMLAMLMLVPSAGFAQWAQIQHDDQKEKQWRSMETGPWDFAPDWYYYLFHHDYSGASLHWRWRGFKSGLEVEFEESDSNVKTIMPVRVLEEETQRQKVKKVNEEYEKIEDRITEGLLYCMTKSGGKMKYQVNEISKENEIICQNIEYIHRQGVGYELENAKRQQAYCDAKTKMEGIVSRVAHLVGMAQCYY